MPTDTSPTGDAPAESPLTVASVDVTAAPPADLAPTARPSGPPPATPAETAVRAQAVAAPAAETGDGQPVRVSPASILVIDIGGTKVKILATGQSEPRKAPTGKDFTPAKLVETVKELADGWDYDAISIGLPSLVGPRGPRSEPGNLGPGWVGFDYAAAFGKPVKMVNDAAMQALGSYEGGRMLFLGLGTGLGSALITGHVIVPLELGRILFDDARTLGEVLGRAGMEAVGKGEWRRQVVRWVGSFMGAFVADYVVVGGGNAKRARDLPPGVRMGHNLTAFRGGFRLWSVEDAWVMAVPGGESAEPSVQEAMRLL